MKRRLNSRKPRQLELAFVRRRLRRRRRRRRTLQRSRVPHLVRPTISEREPAHITTRLASGLPPLRRRAELDALESAFRAGRERFGFRLVHYSVQNDHLHLVVEADDRRALTRGMKGLLVRVARALNRLWHRKGTVFADRYHLHVLRTPREVRNALAYVLNNARKHVGRYAGLDPAASGRFFDGWTQSVSGGAPLTMSAGPPTVAAARTWLLRVGWQRHGRIDPGEMPRSAFELGKALPRE